MDLGAVMTEVAERLKTITGINVFDYAPPTLVPPAGVVSFPDSVDYDQTYGRGMDRISGLPVFLLAGKADSHSAQKTATAWAAGSGPKSVKAALEAGDYRSCGVLQVVKCSFEVVVIAGIDYVAAKFEIEIAGGGS